MSRLRPKGYLCLLILLGAGLTAQVTVAQSAHHEGETTAADVQQEISETYTVLKQYTLEQREEAMAAAEARVASLDARIDELQATIDQRWQSMSAIARANARKALDSLHRQRNEVAEWYGGMKQSSATAWESVKKGFADSYDRLEKAFRQAGEEFGKEN
jgi:hypothetical protein